MTISILGCCYQELCQWPYEYSVLGPIGRAARLMSKLSAGTCETNIHSFLNEKLREQFVKELNKNYANLHFFDTAKTISFEYQHQLAEPEIRRTGTNTGEQICHRVQATDALYFGDSAERLQVVSDRVVYNPKEIGAPKLLSELSGQCLTQILIITLEDAKNIYRRLEWSGVFFTGNELIDASNLSAWLFNKEKTIVAVVIRCEFEGVYVYERNRQRMFRSPIKLGNRKIGSTDIFTAAVAYYWFKTNYDIITCVERSFMVEYYYTLTGDYSTDCNVDYLLNSNIVQTTKSIEPAQIYISGPFFTISQMWLINEVRRLITKLGKRPFSPYHEVGTGRASDIVRDNVSAIRASTALFAIFDGTDAGTLFEIGLACEIGKKVIVLAENVPNSQLTMLKGSNCYIFNDFTEAVLSLWHIK